LRRYYGLQTGAYKPVAYWPCEESVAATQFVNAVDSTNNMTISGTPTLAADSSFNGSDPIPMLSNSTWTGNTGSFISGSGDDVYSTPGTYQWTAPAATVDARVWGAGSGGANGSKGSAGAGGEFAREATLAVTVGSAYTVVVGAGGTGGDGSPNTAHAGSKGDDSSFTGDALSVTAHGGSATSGTTGGAGGTGSTNTTHFDGGAGGSNPSNNSGGAGGGGSAGTAAGGNSGADSSGNSGAAGGAAVTGGGKGGTGGHGGTDPGQGLAGGTPGAGGGGGGDNTSTGYNWAGGSGAAGKVELIYTPASAPSNVIVRCLMHAPSTGVTFGADLLRAVISSGTLSKIELYWAGTGRLGLRGFDTVPSVKFDSGAVQFTAKGTPLMISLELSQSGSNIAWKLTGIKPGSTTAQATSTGSFTGTLGSVSSVVVNPDGTSAGTVMGHVSVQYAAPNILSMANVINGYAGELAGDRFVRLCTETGLAYVFKGASSDTPLMGPQLNQKLPDLFQEIEDADRGQLYETRDRFGLGYRTRVNLMNQAPVLACDYGNATLAGVLEPAADDQLTRNDVTVSRVNGGSQTLTLTTGALSVASPPNGVGDYAFSLSANVNADTQLTNLTQWILNVGTVDEYRYPTVSFDLARSAVAGLFGQIAVLDIGDHFQVWNPPAWLPTGNIKQLAFGFTETLNALTWTIGINAVPESPYEGAGLSW
jgi:hypothetical protein